jgi:prolyl oligopeptidase
MRSLTLLFLFVIIIGCRYNQNEDNKQKYPKTPKSPIVDNYYGKVIRDEYRGLENLKDTTTINWFKAQDELTESYFKQLKTKTVVEKRLSDLYKNEDKAITDVKYSDNGFMFYLKKKTNEIHRTLFYKSSNKSEEIELFDPSNYKKGSNLEYTINYIHPSWEGDYILVSLSYDGIKGSDMIIIDVNHQKKLPEIITNAEPYYYLGVSWLPDSSGFLYLYIPILDPEDDNYMLNSKTVLHKLGDDPNKRNIIFSSSDHFNLTNEDLPIAKILSKYDKYVIGYKASVENYWEAYYADIDSLKNGDIHWRPFYGLEEKIYADYGYFIGDEFIFISGKDADNRTVSSFDMQGAFETKVLVPGKRDEVITSLHVANNTLYYTTSRFGVEAFLYTYKKGKEHKIDLPAPSGEISLYSPSNQHKALYLGLDGWTQGYTRYIYKDNSFAKDGVSNQTEKERFDNIAVKEVLVTSYDGIEVPLSIIYRKNIKWDGSNPTFIFPYGAYGESITPFYSPTFLSWVDNGGVFVVPHIRGGGEKGDSWHKQGMKSTKPNSWKDIIACTEYLINNNYTSKDKTVLYSNSAGGIAIGMAMVERPELFQVFIADVPMLNPLRSEARANNATNYLEYGTVKDSLECIGLIKMDPYVNLKSDIEYPASLIISGYNDDRIDPWIPGKFVAKLQECSTSINPVLLDVIYDVGHEGGDTDRETIELYSRIFAFAFWHTNHDPN